MKITFTRLSWDINTLTMSEHSDLFFTIITSPADNKFTHHTTIYVYYIYIFVGKINASLLDTFSVIVLVQSPSNVSVNTAIQHVVGVVMVTCMLTVPVLMN